MPLGSPSKQGLVGKYGAGSAPTLPWTWSLGSASATGSRFTQAAAVRWDRKTHLHFSPNRTQGSNPAPQAARRPWQQAPASRSEFSLCPIPPSHLLSQQLIPNKHLRPQPTSVSVSAAKEPNNITFHIKTHHNKIGKQKKYIYVCETTCGKSSPEFLQTKPTADFLLLHPALCFSNLSLIIVSVHHI